jgi:hypothetical protein
MRIVLPLSRRTLVFPVIWTNLFFLHKLKSGYSKRASRIQILKIRDLNSYLLVQNITRIPGLDIGVINSKCFFSQDNTGKERYSSEIIQVSVIFCNYLKKISITSTGIAFF